MYLGLRSSEGGWGLSSCINRLRVVPVERVGGNNLPPRQQQFLIHKRYS